MVFPVGSTDIDEIAAQVTALDQRLNRAFAQLASFLNPDGAGAHFQDLSARYAKFEHGPLPIFSIISTATQSLANNTQTAINWSTVFDRRIANNEPAVAFSSNASSEIVFEGVSKGHFHLYWGFIHYEGNSSGQREAIAHWLYSSVSYSGDTISVLPAVASTNITVVPFCGKYNAYRHSVTDLPPKYFAIQGKQGSGGALNITYARLAIARLY